MSSPAKVTIYENVNATGVLVCGAPIGVTSIFATNTSASTIWIQYFDAAALSDVNIGTTKPQWSFPVGDTQGFDGVSFGPRGLRFEHGLCIFATTGPLNATTAGTGVNVQVYSQ